MVTKLTTEDKIVIIDVLKALYLNSVANPTLYEGSWEIGYDAGYEKAIEHIADELGINRQDINHG